MADFNAQLMVWVRRRQQRQIRSEASDLAAAMRQEQPFLRPLAKRRFGVNEVLLPVIFDGHGCERAKTNRYSTPLRPGLRSEVVLRRTEVEVHHGGERVAWHARCYGRGYEFFEL